MSTKFIGMKDFRQNLSAYSKEAKLTGVRIIVLNKNMPVLEVKSIQKDAFTLEKFQEEIEDARTQVKAGEVYTEDDAYRLLNL